MKSRFWSVVIAMVLSMTMLLAGCASTPVKMENDAVQDDFGKTDMGASEFILGVGDSVEIAVYKQDDLKRSVKIDSSGIIMFPLIGDVQVAGKSIFKLRDELRDRFAAYLVNPQITVSITSIQSKKMMILGEVKNPGVFPLDVSFTMTEAIAKAGGLTNDADQGNIVLVRRGKKKAEVSVFDYEDIWKNGNVHKDITLQQGDIVYATTKKIASIARFMSYLGTILAPVVTLEGGIVLWPQMLDALQGKTPNSSFTITSQ